VRGGEGGGREKKSAGTETKETEETEIRGSETSSYTKLFWVQKHSIGTNNPDVLTIAVIATKETTRTSTSTTTTTSSVPLTQGLRGGPIHDDVDPQDLHGVQRCWQPKQRGKRHNEQGGKGSGQLKF